MMKSNVIKQRNLTLRYIWISSYEKMATYIYQSDYIPLIDVILIQSIVDLVSS